MMLDRIQTQARANTVRVTRHAQQEMVEEDISLDEVLEAIFQGRITVYEPKLPKWLTPIQRRRAT